MNLSGVIILDAPVRRIPRRVLKSALQKVLRRVARRCLAWVLEVLRRVLRRGSVRLSGPTATVALSRYTVALHSVALRFPGFKVSVATPAEPRGEKKHFCPNFGR